MKRQATAILGALIFVLLLAIVVGAILAVPGMFLWNLCLVPAIPAIAEVSWLQMWGIMILANIVFRSTVSASTKG